MIAVFYSVSNSKDYDRHTFETCEPKEALRQLLTLRSAECMMYDLNKKCDLLELQCNYNDEMLDGGWWCLMLDVTSEEFNEMFDKQFKGQWSELMDKAREAGL